MHRRDDPGQGDGSPARTGHIGLRRRHKVVLGALVVSAMFLLVNVLVALGEWDGNARSFRAGRALEVSLEAGERRILYMGANESEALRFDVYPSDFDCEVRSPTGTRAPLRPTSGTRLLNVWDSHMAVGSLVAAEPGVHTVSCEGPTTAELILARPARWSAGWASPDLGLIVLALVGLAGGTWLTIAASIARMSRRLRRDV